jgi:signal transduction histidine kinase
VALLGAGGLALLAIVGTSLWLANDARESAVAANDAQATRLHAFRLLGLMQDAETGQRGYLLTGDAAYLQPYVSARAAVGGRIEALRQALAAEHRVGDLGETPQVVAAKLDELQRTIDLQRAGQHAAALHLIDTDEGKALMDRLRMLTDRTIAASDQRVAVANDTLMGDARLLTAVTVTGGVLVILFVAMAGWGAAIYTRDLLRAQDEVAAFNRDLERRVADRTADLVRANDEIQRFAYIVSHDLRAPLVNVMGFTSELEEGLGTVTGYFDAAQPERQAAEAAAVQAARGDMPEAIRFIRSSTGKMDSLINAILKISREGGRVLAPERVDLAALIDRQAQALRHQFEAAGAAFEMTQRPQPIVSDRLALEQVFGNLLDNAVKYLSPDRAGEVTVSVRDLGSRIEVAVTDNGRGIADKDFGRIFELFRRAGAQDRPGEGIGLAHVRALVRRLGGEIDVESLLNKGSCFRVTLPKTMSLPSAGNNQA